MTAADVVPALWFTAALAVVVGLVLTMAGGGRSTSHRTDKRLFWSSLWAFAVAVALALAAIWTAAAGGLLR